MKAQADYGAWGCLPSATRSYVVGIRNEGPDETSSRAKNEANTKILF